jgi:hypothetical protein
MIDLYTYGNSPAAVTLAKIINEKNIPSKKISRLIDKFGYTLNELAKIDRRISFGLAKIIYLQRNDIIKDYPIEIRTYLANVIATKYRIWLVTQKA